ncbi:hypothetical protein JQ582_37150 [Bradyrhizobium japonicum]|jgi:hypothetical protein|uniref:hypothetical protein n=1 Tax=Bradyrhizobium TaxID=374 RepID=UPI000456C41A|nr:hypothetical protein [Bradyrhizobium japonicum]AHY49357.1 hypothetical protein BJS_06987 [Bradyrhizobium japonicum SEMIA 5079]MBR0734830.1 hypothetical protein [Bradyrhizobium japonicum]MBR0749564.1 hypothetical protein [Bradyrhizobium japonicum]MBR0808432.1 hypothetical protein [Bradyrhizobium japonicum]MCD9112253.1 hypothetical protein [Bradyrhizobium japonicum]
MSPSHFDAQRKAGNIPAPKQMLGVVLWDRNDLDRLFDCVSVANDNEDYWDSRLRPRLGADRLAERQRQLGA